LLCDCRRKGLLPGYVQTSYHVSHDSLFTNAPVSCQRLAAAAVIPWSDTTKGLFGVS